MGFDPKNYPADWPEFSRRIRFERAGGRCECTGECGLHGPSLFKPEPRRCVEQDGQPAKWAKGKVMLTVAHLNHAGGPCACRPLCADQAHVKAMCQRCHLRLDVELHTKNRTEKRDAAKLKRLGLGGEPK